MCLVVIVCWLFSVCRVCVVCGGVGCCLVVWFVGRRALFVACRVLLVVRCLLIVDLLCCVSSV